MADSRTDILSEIRRTTVPQVAAPARFEGATRYDDPRKQFAEVLAFVGGRAIFAADPAAAWSELVKLPAIATAKKIGSVVDGFPPFDATFSGTIVRLSEIRDPHDLEDLDVAILPGEFCVAENGAVWVPAASFPHRVLPFITQHLVMVVPGGEIVHNMHEAYERLHAGGSPFAKPGFGAFIAGPSKTADIEQSLVIGAHGPRSHAVVMLG
jgi:L-lactate dehydrogenase complex protein LldG